ncbi:cation efflux protein [Microthyrium microscopicum]|uniref:Cation efflux protein n=1 Tax=Microthyrium microscopicum TaxID=703497 RepID=A0A6A6UR14_9PEZI|nr:cation efflux protein [Microthyrium microscopicum]
MLNDVLSLCVGLWAVNVAQSKHRSKQYTYGWQRAETLGALINGVFLVALCCSIFLEAIQRFFDPPEITSPKWILGVGCAGLSMNILGLFLFHDHGHSHGEETTKKKKLDSNDYRASEEGAIPHHFTDATVADESGNVADVLPENRVRMSTESRLGQETLSPKRNSSSSYRNSLAVPGRQNHNRRRSRQYSTLSDIHVHPASLRNGIIAAGRMEDPTSEPVTDDEDESAVDTSLIPQEDRGSRETTPLLESAGTSPTLNQTNKAHAQHRHAHSHGSKGGHGHSHGDLNMRGVFLHVLGDALGNIGVIATALFIWLTPFSWRFYFDPAISLVITVIILCSAIPLCRAASRILLQATPSGLSVDDIKADILSLKGIVGCHHLHVWQLSDTKLVASLHVRVAFDFKGEGSEEYMELARQVRRCLHGYGIHSSTIQPEFWCKDVQRKQAGSSNPPSEPGTDQESCSQEDTASEANRPRDFGSSAACLLDCDDECGDGGKCCAPVRTSTEE